MRARDLPPVRSWAIATAAGAAATLGMYLAGLPSPVLFGTLLGGMAYALVATTPLAVPRRAFTVGQGLIGATIGAMVNLSALERLASDWGSILAVTLGTLAISLVAGRAMAVRRDVSVTTGVFALVAGGASGVVAVAGEVGADDRVVTIVQYLRVLVVLLAMPVIATIAFHPATVARSLPTAGATSLGSGVAYTVASVLVGLVLARITRLPAGGLLGPLLVAVVLSVTGVLGEVGVPALLVNAGYALIGMQVGLRFTRASLRSILRLLPLAIVLILAVIAACAAMGALLARLTGIDELTAYLATTPGGLYAVLALAANSGADVTYVLTVQVIRVFAMLLAAPLLARILVRRPAGGTGRRG